MVIEILLEVLGQTVLLKEEIKTTVGVPIVRMGEATGKERERTVSWAVKDTLQKEENTAQRKGKFKRINTEKPFLEVPERKYSQ
jgi:hypothetical protein